MQSTAPPTIRLLWPAFFLSISFAIACGESPVEDDPGDAIADSAPVADAGTPDQPDVATAAKDTAPAIVGCVNAPDGTPCDDGEPCSVDDRCAGGKCAAGENVCECTDNAGCQSYEDGDACNGTLFCDLKVFPYRCLVNPGSIVTCDDDGKPCSVRACDPLTGECASKPGPDGSPCLDADPCTVESSCVGGKCQGSAASWCACKEDADCANVGSGDKCGGTFFCDTAVFPHQCSVSPGSVVECSDNKDTTCTKNACEPKTGNCAPTPVEKLAKACSGTGVQICRWVPLPKGAKKPVVSCDDGDECSQSETCADGKCSAGLDVCKCTKNADCDKQEDGDLCNGTLYCDVAVGICKLNPKTKVTCPTVGDTACTKNTCNPITGTCAPTPVKPGAPCDDDDVCTKGEICKEGQCKAGANICQCKSNADCEGKDDGDKCNGVYFCNLQSGTCESNPASVVHCSKVDDTDCAKAACAPKTGLCAPVPVKNLTACDDGDKCTKGETCIAGKCGGGQPICVCKSNDDCVAEDDGNLCNGTLFCNKALKVPACEFNPASVVKCANVDDTDCLKKMCLPQTGKCAFQPVKTGGKCEDGDDCTVGDWCLDGACKGGTDTCECHKDADCAAKDDGDKCNGTWFCDISGKMPACKPNPASKVWCSKEGDSACLHAVCNTKTGQCALQPRKDGTACPPGSACVAKASCSSGECKGSGKVDCDDANPCTIDSCHAKTGCANKAVACDDGNGCTLDTCNSKTGACSSQPGPMQGKGCDADGTGCTVNDFCNAGKCVVGNAVLCPKASEACMQGQCVSLTAQSYKCAIVPSKEGSPCVGSHACLLGSTCKAGKCIAGKQEKLFRRERFLAGQSAHYAAVVGHPQGGYVAVGGIKPDKGGGSSSWLVDRLTATGEPAVAKPLVLPSPAADKEAAAVDAHAAVGGTLVAGTVTTKSAGKQVRILALGPDIKTKLWDRSHGGAKDETTAGLAPLVGGGWLIAGHLGSVDSDGLSLRLSATGLLLATWTKAEAGAQALLDGAGMADGGALLVGWRKPAGGKQQAWLLRLDGGWKHLWSHALGGASAQALTTIQRVGGTTVAAGWQGAPVPHAWWMDLDALGKVRWQKTTTLPSEAWSMVPAGGGSFVLAGRLATAVPSGWLAGIDPAGNMFWQREISQGSDERLARLVAAADGGFLAAGRIDNKGKKGGLLLRTDAWGRAGCAASGVCAAKKLTDCADGKACTHDLCDAAGGCAPANNTISCDDGDACTTADACQGGNCLGGGKTNCDDANACTGDSCDPKKGCLHKPLDNASCADDSVCTTDEKCVFGTCQLKKKDCDDKQACTIDACDAKKGCLYKTIPDDTPCGGNKVCLLGTCTKRWAVAISAGSGYTAAASPDGKVRTWGYSAYGTLGRHGNAIVPGELPNVPPSVKISAAGLFGCAATNGGQIYCWGAGPHGIGCGVGSQIPAVPVVKWTDTAVALSAGNGSHVCAIAKSGLMRCWGSNGYGNCGIGVAGKSLCVPGQAVLDLNDAVQVDSGGEHTCARTKTGKVRCWGRNYKGQLGNGGPISHLNKTYVPKDVKGLVDAVDMSSSNNHVCAVRAKGGVVCWGYNNQGQLGDGSLTSRSAPVPVFALKDAIQVSANGSHTCALRKTGTVACWGYNNAGQLGNGNKYKSTAPLPVAGLDGVIEVSAGDSHTCALRKNGEVRCWGSNNFGQLGDGKSKTIALKPVTVLGSAP